MQHQIIQESYENVCTISVFQRKEPVLTTHSKLRLALLAGGTSGERNVSLDGAKEIMANLDPEKYIVTQYDPACDLQRIATDKDSIDVALINLHGVNGEDGTVQGFLDLLNIPYQGSGVLGSAIAMDKDLSKRLYRENGLPVARWELVTAEAQVEEALRKLSLPVVVKPVKVGSSLGLTIGRTQQEVVDGVCAALPHDSRIMLEEYIEGREITIGVLGNDAVEALPVIEIIPGEKYDFFDYEAKYQPGATQEVCPAEIDEKLARTASSFAVKAHKVLRLANYSRTDMMVTREGRLYLLETNTIPGMTETSLFPQAAAVYGLNYSALLDRLIELAME